MAEQAGAEPIVHRKQMGFSRSDFTRTLPRVFGDAYRITGDRVEGSDGDGGEVVIEMGPEQVRQIALIRLPFMDIVMTLTGFTADEAAAFMVRFDRSYQRGGG